MQEGESDRISGELFGVRSIIVSSKLALALVQVKTIYFDKPNQHTALIELRRRDRVICCWGGKRRFETLGRS